MLSAILGRGLGAGGQLVATLLLGRFYGASGAGILLLGVTLVIIASTVGRLGLEYSLLKQASLAFGHQNHGRFWSLVRQTFPAAIGVSAAISALLVILGGILWWLDQLPDARLAGTMPWFLVAIPLYSSTILQGELLKSCDQPGWGNMIGTAVTPWCFVLLCAIAYQSGHPELEWGAASYLLATLVATVGGWICLFRFVPRNAHPDPIEPGEIWIPMRSLWWFSTLTILNNWIPLLMLSLLTESADWGRYGTAARLATAVSFVLWASNAIVPTQFARLHGQGDHGGLQRLAFRAGVSLTLAAAVPALFLVLGGRWLLGWMGDEFVSASVALAILAGAQWINAMAGPVDYLLVVTGNERQLRQGAILAALTNFILCVCLIPRWHVSGAAVATALSIALERAWYCWSAWKRTGIITLPIPRRSDVAFDPGAR